MSASQFSTIRAGHTTPAETQAPALFADCPDLMDVDLFAARLGVSRAVAWAMCRKGQVPNVKIGRRVFIPRDKLAAFVEAGCNG